MRRPLLRAPIRYQISSCQRWQHLRQRPISLQTMSRPRRPAALPLQDGVSASCAVVHGGPWASALDFLTARLPVLHRDEWAERFARGEVLDALADVLRDEQRSILFSSHNTADIEQIADSITFLHAGGIVASRDKDAFLDGWRRILCRGDKADALRSLPGVAWVRDSAPLIELKTGGFDATTLPALQALGLAVEAVEPMTLEDIFVTTVHGSRSA